MRYQSALVLSTLAVGQAAAANHNHRHASFHARRSAQSSGPEGVEWNKVVRDAVDYDAAIKAANIPQASWDAIFASKNGQPAATQAAAVPAQQEQPKETPAPEPAYESQPATSQEKPSSTSEAEPKPTGGSGGSGGSSSNVLASIGCQKEATPKDANGKIWIGESGSKTQFTFTNDANEDAALFCWDFSSMFDPKNSAIIATNIGSGQSLTVSLAPSFSGGCGPAFADSGFHFSGILDETIIEFTTAPEKPDMYVTGVYDISKEVNMKGVVMSATGNKKCTSGVLNGAVSCLFGCTGDATTCEDTGTYGIDAGVDASGFCNKGVDTKGNGGASGGCQFDPNGDHVKITFSNDRSWPKGSYTFP